MGGNSGGHSMVQGPQTGKEMARFIKNRPVVFPLKCLLEITHHGISSKFRPLSLDIWDLRSLRHWRLRACRVGLGKCRRWTCLACLCLGCHCPCEELGKCELLDSWEENSPLVIMTWLEKAWKWWCFQRKKAPFRLDFPLQCFIARG